MMNKDRIALAITLGALITSARAATGPAAPGSSDAEPQALYDTSFTPFDDTAQTRLRYPQVLPPATPLFSEYDPLAGLDQHTKTSRVALTNRAVFALPVLTVHAGDEFDMPFYQQTGPDIPALGLHLQFDPKVVRILSARPVNWKGASVVTNDTPEHITPERQFKIAEFSGYPFTTKGSILSLHMKAVAPGDSDIIAFKFEISDSTFNLAPALLRNGLVHVLP